MLGVQICEGLVFSPVIFRALSVQFLCSTLTVCQVPKLVACLPQKQLLALIIKTLGIRKWKINAEQTKIKHHS